MKSLVGSGLTVQVDATAPSVSFTSCPSTVYLGSVATASWAATDEHSGVVAPASGTIPLDTTSVLGNPKTVPAPIAYDNVGHASNQATCTYSVIYNWAGFFQPIDNLPTLNSVKAGSAIPTKFSLGGNQGLGIFQTGYPKSYRINCDSSAYEDAIESTVTAGGSSLTYDATANQYVYVWKTEKSWAGTCRQLDVMLIDGTHHYANFKFK